MITDNPEQLYRTLEIENPELGKDENSERRKYNIQQLALFKERVQKDAVVAFRGSLSVSDLETMLKERKEADAADPQL